MGLLLAKKCLPRYLRRVKAIFYCSVNRNNFPKRSYLLYDNKNDRVHFYKNFVKHEHHHIERDLTPEQKEIIRRLYSDGLTKLSLILIAIENEDVDTPHKSTVVSFLSRHKVNMYGKNQISLGELAKCCSDHSARTEELDKGFVFN